MGPVRQRSYSDLRQRTYLLVSQNWHTAFLAGIRRRTDACGIRAKYEESGRDQMLANIPWTGQEDGQNQEIMEDDEREDIESDAASEHSEHNTDSEQ
ncbi:hypothetical protein JTB14_033752 [Gonioctena quinquepunctata]|nr:hypothetical protein JTB14_033752 [Gonioctena quinquepunctata]